MFLAVAQLSGFREYSNLNSLKIKNLILSYYSFIKKIYDTKAYDQWKSTNHEIWLHVQRDLLIILYFQIVTCVTICDMYVHVNIVWISYMHTSIIKRLLDKKTINSEKPDEKKIIGHNIG